MEVLATGQADNQQWYSNFHALNHRATYLEERIFNSNKNSYKLCYTSINYKKKSKLRKILVDYVQTTFGVGNYMKFDLDFYKSLFGSNWG